MTKQVTILTGEPTVSVIGKMELDWDGVMEMARWVKDHRPECLPDGFDPDGDVLHETAKLFPHDMRDTPEFGRVLSGNELLVELAGRKCYDSFGLKAGKKSNREYVANTQMHVDPRAKAVAVADDIIDADDGNRSATLTYMKDRITDAITAAQNAVPHASIVYHAKISFFIAGVSRRVSHELIRNYVGADRDEEGSPSQESTRYTEHYGFYVAHPYILGAGGEIDRFEQAMQVNYDRYLDYVSRQTTAAKIAHGITDGGKLSTIERKRILESASPYLSHACETSWIWTTNPMALAKMIKERDTDAADLEFRRLARVLKRVAVAHSPNLYPQPWMVV